jgi:lipid A disaccharide synthetase
MVVAGEPSGDVLAAELVKELRAQFNSVVTVPSTDLQPLQTSLEPQFFGVGGRQMAAAGANPSLVHVDWMIGSGELDIDGNGVIEIVLRIFSRLRKLFH